MPVVETSVFIRGPREAAYAVAKRHEEFPRYMQDVESVRTLERRADGSTLSEWVGRLQGKRMRWVEVDTYDDANCRIRYRQTEGDLKKMEGEWRFEPEDGGTRATLVVDFELGVPMFAGLLEPIAKLVVRNNSAAMLEAIKRQVEAGTWPSG
jgi:coenzyme Q-binding protein COQ10